MVSSAVCALGLHEVPRRCTVCVWCPVVGGGWETDPGRGGGVAVWQLRVASHLRRPPCRPPTSAP